jgi:hypothetical protein
LGGGLGFGLFFSVFDVMMESPFAGCAADTSITLVGAKRNPDPSDSTGFLDATTKRALESSGRACK